MRWLFIHIPRTGGSSIREQIGYGISHDHEHLPIQAYDTEGVFVFTITRNPFDRAVSLCAARPGRDRSVALPVGEFEQWVSDGFPIRHILKGTPHTLSMAAPMVDFVRPEHCDRVLPFEVKRYTYEAITQITNVKCDSRQVGATTHLMWPQYYRSDETWRAVVEQYSDDFEEYGYPCGVSRL